MSKNLTLEKIFETKEVEEVNGEKFYAIKISEFESFLKGIIEKSKALKSERNKLMN